MWAQRQGLRPHQQAMLMRLREGEVSITGSIQGSEYSRVSRAEKENIPTSEDTDRTLFRMILHTQRAHSLTCTSTHQHHQVRGGPVPVDGADAGNTVHVTHPLQQQPVSDLPGKQGGVAVFQVEDRLHNRWGGNFRLWAPNHSWSDAPCLVVPEFTILVRLWRTDF